MTTPSNLSETTRRNFLAACGMLVVSPVTIARMPVEGAEGAEGVKSTTAPPGYYRQDVVRFQAGDWVSWTLLSKRRISQKEYAATCAEFGIRQPLDNCWSLGWRRSEGTLDCSRTFYVRVVHQTKALPA